MYVLLITRLLRGVGRWTRKPVNHTSWVAVVTPTDRPKSVRNRCLIDLFVALFVLSLCPFDISVGVEAFVIGLSQISSFLSLVYKHKEHVICVIFIVTLCYIGASFRPVCSRRNYIDCIDCFQGNDHHG